MLDGGYNVIGIDIDPDKINILNSGQTYIQHLPPDMFASARAEKRFRTTGNLDALLDRRYTDMRSYAVDKAP